MMNMLPDRRRKEEFAPKEFLDIFRDRYESGWQPKGEEGDLLLKFAKSQQLSGAFFPEVAVGYTLGLEYLEEQGTLEEESQKTFGLDPSSIKNMYGQPGSLTADAVVVNGRELTVVEVKARLDTKNDRGFKAFGQALTYQHLLSRDLEHEGLSDFQLDRAILVSKIDKRFKGIGLENNISVYTL